jgi:hypothetical protein
MFLSVFCLFVCFSSLEHFLFSRPSRKRGVTYRATDLKFEIEKNLILEKKKLCLKWNDPSLLFLLHMLDLSLPLLKFFFGFLIVTPPESHLSLILANWTIQFLPAPEKSSNWSFFWNLGSLSPDSPSQTKTIDLVVCYIRMFISGPFKQLFISFLGLRQFTFFLCVCVPRLPPFFFVAIFAMNFVFAHLITPSPTHDSTSFSRWFSMQEQKEKKHNEKDWKNSLSSRLSFQFILPCVCVCVRVLIYYSIFWIHEEKSSCRHHHLLRPIISSHHTTVKSSSEKFRVSGTCQNNKNQSLPSPSTLRTTTWWRKKTTTEINPFLIFLLIIIDNLSYSCVFCGWVLPKKEN